MTKSFQPCPALTFFDMSTSACERRRKRPVVPDHISNEQHAKRLDEVERSLWVLCHHFKVLPEQAKAVEQQQQKKEGQKPDEKPPENMILPEELIEIMTAINPQKQINKVVERVLGNDTDQMLNEMRSKQPNQFLQKMFDMSRLAQISQDAERAMSKVPLAQFDHSYSVLTEIKTSIVTTCISDDSASTTTVQDHYGVPWQLRLRKDIDWLIVDVDISKCRGVMGRFRVLVRFLHESPLMSYPCSVPIDVNRTRTIYCGTLGSVNQLRDDGYFAADGTLKLRVAIVPIDPDAERSTLMVGKRLKQIPANHNAHRLPKFTEGQLTIPDFLNSRTTQSETLQDSNQTVWRLEVRLNQGANEHERMHMGVSIDQCGGPVAPDTCYEYFVELLTVDAGGWTLRQSGRTLDGSVSIPDFLLKSRAEIYLKDGKLRLRWGVRRIPIR